MDDAMPLETWASDLPNLHVLMASSDHGARRDLINLLDASGITKMTIAGTGADALLKIMQTLRPIDVVLADYRITNGNGLQLLKAIRSGQVKNARRDVCFIMVSDITELDVIRTAAQLHIHRYLVRPLTVDKLRAAIIGARQRSIALDPEGYASVQV
jgi:response regulator of citrate/malate metabolism